MFQGIIQCKPNDLVKVYFRFTQGMVGAESLGISVDVRYADGTTDNPIVNEVGNGWYYFEETASDNFTWIASTGLSTVDWTELYGQVRINDIIPPTVEEIDAKLTSQHGSGSWNTADVSIVPSVEEIAQELLATFGPGPWTSRAPNIVEQKIYPGISEGVSSTSETLITEEGESVGSTVLPEDIIKSMENILKMIAQLELRVEALSETSIQKDKIDYLYDQLDNVTKTLNTISGKIENFETINISSSELEELLALKGVLARILDNQRKLEEILPSSITED